jgi:antitoxin CcdA
MAKEHGINLSATLEEALVAKVRTARQQRWLAKNAISIAAYNDHVDKHGVVSDGHRSF